MKLKIKMFISIVSLTLMFLSIFMLLQMYVTKDYTVSGQTAETEKTAALHTTKPLLEVEKYYPKTTSATLVGMGDILIHDTVYNAARVEHNLYDFKPMLTKVKPLIEGADIAFANQETMIGGTELGLSSYPRFNSPYEVGDALKDAGIDIVSMANNHTLDRGEIAIQNAINYWNKLGVAYVGSYKSEADKEEIRILDANDITFSFLAYTYGTNGIPIPTGKDYLVNLINLEAMKKEIERSKQLSDVTVVSIHFGNEYQRMPSDDQKNIVKQLVDAGADIILGHHPHVLQPVEWIEKENGGKAFVIYSLGNFISGQRHPYREIGGIVQLTVEKTGFADNYTIEIKNPTFLPTYVVNRKFTVIPLNEQYPLDSNIYKDIESHMKKWMPELAILQ
ncbi:CapA family protein [Calidifontibacillus oryziterrae]|uniref:CapA family protein n=1 Tax=Calidifontibacillus oryziterrae TaxID=1191699 RepID=UPI0002FFD487|nr:CapA family protein [Calidifontibacillus oryziterrae]